MRMASDEKLRIEKLMDELLKENSLTWNFEVKEIPPLSKEKRASWFSYVPKVILMNFYSGDRNKPFASFGFEVAFTRSPDSPEFIPERESFEIFPLEAEHPNHALKNYLRWGLGKVYADTLIAGEAGLMNFGSGVSD